jgi:sigma-54-specific transcriptional regulator
LTFLPGTSPAVVSLRREIAKLNSHPGTSLVGFILVRGESGSGKGYVSRVLAGHRRYLKISETKENPGIEAGLGAFLGDFQSVLLPALPEALIESELFGYKAGAFTDAKKDRVGYLAQGYSDVLLDEIGDASVALQAKLLGVLEDRRFLPIGAGRNEQEDLTARLIAATNRDLEHLIRLDRFREDLYWRLIEHPIHVPALREQPENIHALCKRIIAELHGSMSGADVPQKPELRPDDIDWATSYEWPGNVRQLKHALRMWLLEGATTRLRDVVNAIDSLNKSDSSGNSVLTDWRV